MPYYAVIRCGNFYPRPPGGGRHLYAQFFSMPPEISIHALRVEGDFSDWLVPFYYYISIHALRVEGDIILSLIRCGFTISIHALRVEGDNVAALENSPMQSISIHALRVEGDSLA